MIVVQGNPLLIKIKNPTTNYILANYLDTEVSVPKLAIGSTSSHCAKHVRIDFNNLFHRLRCCTNLKTNVKFRMKNDSQKTTQELTIQCRVRGGRTNGIKLEQMHQAAQRILT